MLCLISLNVLFSPALFQKGQNPMIKAQISRWVNLKLLSQIRKFSLACGSPQCKGLLTPLQLCSVFGHTVRRPPTGTRASLKVNIPDQARFLNLHLVLSPYFQRLTDCKRKHTDQYLLRKTAIVPASSHETFLLRRLHVCLLLASKLYRPNVLGCPPQLHVPY